MSAALIVIAVLAFAAYLLHLQVADPEEVIWMAIILCWFLVVVATP